MFNHCVYHMVHKINQQSKKEKGRKYSKQKEGERKIYRKKKEKIIGNKFTLREKTNESTKGREVNLLSDSIPQFVQRGLMHPYKPSIFKILPLIDLLSTHLLHQHDIIDFVHPVRWGWGSGILPNLGS